MDADRPDSLEGWVAIKRNVFEEAERFRLSFLVAWNEVEGRFAVTCHNRTLQRRSAAPGPGQPEAEAQAQASWAALYCPQELRDIHRQLVASCAALEPCFPVLPELKPAGLWGLLFPGRSLAEGWESGAGLDSVCRQLECYLGAAIDLCGRRIALDSLFPSGGDTAAEYFENMTEFRRKSLEEQVSRAKEALRQILYQHKTAEDMVALKTIYQDEDEAYQELVTVATQFYQYLLQPFRDMREFASLCKQEVLKSLEFDELGPKRIQSLQKEAEEWSRRMQNAVCSIQDITLDYFKETVKAVSAMQKQMEEDRNHFGKAAWASAAPRLEKLKFMFAKETLQHMRSKELCFNRKKTEIRDKMEHLDTEETVETVDELEMQYYETQLELYGIQLETLKYEELLLVAQLDTIRRQVKEREEEVVYYDACEDPEELQATEGMGLVHDSRPGDVKKLRHKAHQLETKRGRIGIRRSYLRNKRDQCEESQKAKQQREQGDERRFRQHHSIQLKHDEKKEENKRRREWVNQERQKTLQRLRTFKEKSSAHIVFKPPRCQTLGVQRQCTSSIQASSVSDQPMSLIDHPASKPSKKQSETRTPKAPKNNLKAPGDIPVQIFLPAGGLVSPEQAENQGISSAVPPATSPPSPPPLPPPPPPPITFLGRKSTPADDDQGQRLVFSAENSAKQSLKENIGTMDDVLASLKRGEVFLKKVDQTKQRSLDKCEGLRDGMLAAIRQGVRLRKVTVDVNLPTDADPANELERSIKAAMKRMKKVSPDSDDEDQDDGQSGEWDS